jgi:hypothetical protein
MEGDIVSRPSTVVSVFGDRDSLEKALEELKEAGFRDEQVGVAMRGLREEGGKDREQFEAVEWATQSILTVRVEGRHEEAEEILRRHGADEIKWTNSRTPSIAGTAEEIVGGTG